MPDARRQKTFCLSLPAAAVGICCALAPLPTHAQSIPAQPRVSVTMRGGGLGAALTLLADQTAGRVRFEASPEVRSLVVVAVVNDQPLETALRALLRAASPRLGFTVASVGGLTVYRIGETQVGRGAANVTPKPSSAPVAPLLTLDAAGASLADVLRAVFPAAGDARVEGADASAVTVTAVFTRLPLERALDAIAGGARPGLEWSRENGAVVFRPRTGAFSGGEPVPPSL